MEGDENKAAGRETQRSGQTPGRGGEEVFGKTSSEKWSERMNEMMDFPLISEELADRREAQVAVRNTGEEDFAHLKPCRRNLLFLKKALRKRHQLPVTLHNILGR